MKQETSTIQWLTFAAAVFVPLISAYLLRRTGKGQVAAAERSGIAAEKSAAAATAAVDANRATALGVAQRAEADALAKRYQDASLQLGHGQAPVRLAGVYALAKLADDWEVERQSCVDVLCAYLRMPRVDESGPHQAEDDEVRKTILKCIATRCGHGGAGSPEVQTSWRDCSFDLSGSEFATFSMVHCNFTHELNLSSCRFVGTAEFDDCIFDHGLRLDGALIEGNMTMQRLSGSHVALSDVNIKGELTLIPVAQLTENAMHWFVNQPRVSGSLTIFALKCSKESQAIDIDKGNLKGGRLTVLESFVAGEGDSAFTQRFTFRDWRTDSSSVVKILHDLDGRGFVEVSTVD